MAVKHEGSNIVVNQSVAGSIFPTNEKDAVYPVLVDGSKQHVKIEGSLYGRAVELRGDVLVSGPIVARGDLKINPLTHRVQLSSGLTVNGSVNCHQDTASTQLKASVFESVRNVDLIIKGDIAVNQNIFLKNAVVLGSLRAVNCTLENTIVLGTCIVEEHLTIRMSSVGGYAARDVQFEGACMMIHALGESLNKPKLLPYESQTGGVFASDIRYYPAIRNLNHLLNLTGQISAPSYPDYSLLHEVTDWVESPASPNLALDEQQVEALNKWILSIGGRIGDVSIISNAIASLTGMLKCGFEFEHYHPQKRAQYVSKVAQTLTPEEAWVLESACQ